MRLALLMAVVGCKHEGNGGTGDTGTAFTGDLLPAASELKLDDTTNIGWSATVTMATTPVAPGQNFAIDWSGLTHDLFGGTVAAADVKQVALSALTLTPEQAAVGLGRGGLDPTSVAGRWIAAPAGVTTVAAASLQDTDHIAFDPAVYATGEYTLLVVLTDRDNLMRSAALATADGAATSVPVGDASIDYTITLADTAMSTKTSLGPWSFDWSTLAVSATGAKFSPTTPEQLWIARLEGSPDPDNAFVLDPLPVSDEYYIAPVHTLTGEVATKLISADGIYFQGFTEPGTWFVGLSCSGCPLPVPYYVGRLQVLR